MPTEAELEQLFVRVSELEAWRKVKDGSVQKEVPKEPAPKGEVPKAPPFPSLSPNPASPPKNENHTTSGTQSQTSKK